jgi:hypothetical protein
MRCGKQVLWLVVLLGLHSGSVAAAEREVVLEWLASSDARGFFLHLGGSQGSYQERLDLGEIPPDPDGIHRAAVLLDDLSEYYAAMTAYNDVGESGLSNEIHVLASACDVTPCDDGNACTADDCDVSGCTNTVLSDGTPCGLEGICTAGACVEAQCSDAQHCDDGDACNGTERCSGDGLCLAGPPLDCGQPTQCAEPICDPDRGCAMQPLPDGTSCDDGDPGTRKDRCRAGTCEGDVKPLRDNTTKPGRGHGRNR